MGNLLISIGLAGIATTFVIEFISLALNLFLDKETIYKILSLPLSFGAMYCFGHINKLFFVTVPATAFIVLVINKWLNTPVVLNYNRRNLPRL